MFRGIWAQYKTYPFDFFSALRTYFHQNAEENCSQRFLDRRSLTRVSVLIKLTRVKQLLGFLVTLSTSFGLTTT